MLKSRWTNRLIKSAMWLVPGMAVLGTSCAQGIQESLVSAGLDFVEDNASDVLNALFPIAEWLGL